MFKVSSTAPSAGGSACGAILHNVALCNLAWGGFICGSAFTAFWFWLLPLKINHSKNKNNML